MGSDVIQMLPVNLDHEGNLYFEAQVLETDSWNISGKRERAQIFRNPNNDVLIAQPGDKTYPAVFERRTDQEIQNGTGIKFDIYSYYDTDPKGLAVAFAVEYDSKPYHMCVEREENKMRVNFKAGPIPTRIEGNSSDVIFIKRQFTPGSRQFHKFESALEPGYFLAFERVRDCPGMALVVKKVGLADEVDESIKLHHAAVPL